MQPVQPEPAANWFTQKILNRTGLKPCLLPQDRSSPPIARSHHRCPLLATLRPASSTVAGHSPPPADSGSSAGGHPNKLPTAGSTGRIKNRATIFSGEILLRQLSSPASSSSAGEQPFSPWIPSPVEAPAALHFTASSHRRTVPTSSTSGRQPHRRCLHLRLPPLLNGSSTTSPSTCGLEEERWALAFNGKEGRKKQKARFHRKKKKRRREEEEGKRKRKKKKKKRRREEEEEEEKKRRRRREEEEEGKKKKIKAHQRRPISIIKPSDGPNLFDRTVDF